MDLVEISPPPSPSDESDFYDDDHSTTQQPEASATAEGTDLNSAGQANLTSSIPGVPDEDSASNDDDASADMEMSSEDDSPPPEPASKPLPLPSPSPLPSHAGAKRSLETAGSDDTNPVSESAERPSQRPRLSSEPSPAINGTASTFHPADLNATHPFRESPQHVQQAQDQHIQPAQPIKQSNAASRAPDEIWQNIFVHLPPQDLARCLRVSINFLRLLTGTPQQTPSKLNQPPARQIGSEAIWAEVRKKFFPNTPRPLGSHTELEMWRLIHATECDNKCNRRAYPLDPQSKIYARGPGLNNVRPIYPLGRALCGPCLEETTRTVSRSWLTSTMSC
jgi:hypothetical protein